MVILAETLRYFDIATFKYELSEFLQANPTFYVTAMCPICQRSNGYTTGIYVTFKEG